MIARIIRGRSFSGLMKYLTSKSKALTPDHLRARNIVSIERAAKEMRVVADQSKRIKKPTYHLILAWAPEEAPSREQQMNAAERLLALIGLESNQAVLVVHDEAKAGLIPGTDGRHHEVHICVNRVRFDGSVAKLSHDYCLVERAAFQIAEEFGFRQVSGRFNEAKELQKPGLGDKIGSIKAESGENTIADEIRQNTRRLDALRKARRRGWGALVSEFQRQGIGLMLGPPPRRADLQRGLVMIDLKTPARRLKISALDSSFEKWGAGALVKELGPLPESLCGGPETQSSGLLHPEALLPDRVSKTELFEKFSIEKDKVLASRSETTKRHELERSGLIKKQREERDRVYAHAKKRREILNLIFGRRSLLRRVLNCFFDAMFDERRVELKKAHDRQWKQLRTRHQNERLPIPRWAEWRKANGSKMPNGSHLPAGHGTVSGTDIWSIGFEADNASAEPGIEAGR